jgi:3-deoxy-D-manno-octulosonic acid kinase
MREISTDDGAMLLAEAAAGVIDASWFDRAANGDAETPRAGRGGARFFDTPIGRVFYRPYRRGGLVARFNRDRHLWQGAAETRCFVEMRLLAELQVLGLPVPEPLAARYRRTGLYYRAEIVVREIPSAQTLAERMARTPGVIEWEAVGAALGRFHSAGVDHADLNAHNILFDSGERVWVVDFDRSTRRAPGPWADSNLARLKRSLDKLGAGECVAEFEGKAWPRLLEAWRRGLVA